MEMFICYKFKEIQKQQKERTFKLIKSTSSSKNLSFIHCNKILWPVVNSSWPKE